jgi:hypothetical protein
MCLQQINLSEMFSINVHVTVATHGFCPSNKKNQQGLDLEQPYRGRNPVRLIKWKSKSLLTSHFWPLVAAPLGHRPGHASPRRGMSTGACRPTKGSLSFQIQIADTRWYSPRARCGGGSPGGGGGQRQRKTWGRGMGSGGTQAGGRGGDESGLKMDM